MIKGRVPADPRPEPAGALGESRARVLDLLRPAGAGLTAQEVAERTGLHPNTARFHLEGLVEAGLAERATEAAGRPGRPSTVYRARPAQESPRSLRSYRLLAEILTTVVAEHLPRKAAAEAGRMWGAYLTERPAPFETVDVDRAVGRLVGLLAEIGFAPEADSPAGAVARDVGRTESGPDATVRLHHCPFHEVAEQHGEVVCALHLGLMQGALAEARAPLAAERLEPFVAPSLCVAYLKVLPG